jgi:hypothetical protein
MYKNWSFITIILIKSSRCSWCLDIFFGCPWDFTPEVRILPRALVGYYFVLARRCYQSASKTLKRRDDNFVRMAKAVQRLDNCLLLGVYIASVMLALSTVVCAINVCMMFRGLLLLPSSRDWVSIYWQPIIIYDFWLRLGSNRDLFNTRIVYKLQ